ncbi:hypothetical protein B0H19DRAFT_1095819 [Mycena capillaripes]|nr:hypothetical protein B0H19DRAFT_1095819 [Mycena capillaripes]
MGTTVADGNASNASNALQIGTLRPKDIYWRDIQPWLEKQGYMLRARYRPNWVPSWKDTGKYAPDYEDFFPAEHYQTIDATRMSDGLPVMLKRIKTDEHPREVEIWEFLSSEQLQSDPKNHCIPLLANLHEPDTDSRILVMKLLRRYEDPHFDSIGEGIDFIRQIFEGVQFMHKHLVAHRDCCSGNIMMDGSRLYPKGFHPMLQDRYPDGRRNAPHLTRTRAAPKYYLIDFGISVRFERDVLPHTAFAIEGGDKSVPEFKGLAPSNPMNPFPTDVYYLGNLIRTEFMDGQFDPMYPLHAGRFGFEFLRPLVNDMVNPNPEERPSIDEVVASFDKIVSGLSSWKLRSWARRKQEYVVLSIPRIVRHWCRQIGYVVRRVPAIPNHRIHDDQQN